MGGSPSLFVRCVVMNERDVRQLDAVRHSVRHVVGDGAIGVYHFGSALMGGLRPGSDLDVFVVLDRETSLDERTALVGHFLSVSGRRGSRIAGRPIEVTMARQDELRPWRRDPLREFQYGEWLRDDYEAGLVPEPVIDHDLAPLVATLLAASRALFGPPVEDLLAPVPEDQLVWAMRYGVPDLLNELASDTGNVLLTLARISYTIRHGRIATKDVAAAWALTELPDSLRDPLAMARLAYLGDIAQTVAGSASDTNETAHFLATEMIGSPLNEDGWG